MVLRAQTAGCREGFQPRKEQNRQGQRNKETKTSREVGGGGGIIGATYDLCEVGFTVRASEATMFLRPNAATSVTEHTVAVIGHVPRAESSSETMGVMKKGAKPRMETMKRGSRRIMRRGVVTSHDLISGAEQRKHRLPRSLEKLQDAEAQDESSPASRNKRKKANVGD